MMALLALIVIFIEMFTDAASQPVRVHLSLTGDVTEMVVMWQTADMKSATLCRYGTSSGLYTQNVTGTSDSYTTKSYSSGLIHTAILINLFPSTIYFYQCGDISAWSSEFNFTAAPIGQRPVRILTVGDLGTTIHSQSTINGMMNQPSDLIYHVGDMSYADVDTSVWDEWFDMVQPIASTMPLMVLPGNHENYYNFVSFKKLFLMPSRHSGSTGDNFYYSFDYSYIHFISLSSESDYSQSSVQYAWLQSDLARVNRVKTPFIVVGWHRPWYSSSTAHQGEGTKMMQAMESLLYSFKVDLCITGHVHSYERTYPVYNWKITKDGPIHVVVGDGGNREGIPPFQPQQPNWSAIRIPQYGYSIFNVFNRTHLHFEMHQDDNWHIVDDFWIIKSSFD